MNSHPSSNNIQDILDSTEPDQDIHIDFETGAISVLSGGFTHEYEALQERRADNIQSLINRTLLYTDDPAITIAGWKHECRTHVNDYYHGGERGGYHMPGPTTVCGKPEYLALEWEDVGKYIPDLVIYGICLGTEGPTIEHGNDNTMKVCVNNEKSKGSWDNGSPIPMFVLEYRAVDRNPCSETKDWDRNDKELVWIPLSEVGLDDDRTMDTGIKHTNKEEWIRNENDGSYVYAIDSNFQDTVANLEFECFGKYPDHYENHNSNVPVVNKTENMIHASSNITNYSNSNILYHDIINSIQQEKTSPRKYTISPSSVIHSTLSNRPDPDNKSSSSCLQITGKQHPHPHTGQPSSSNTGTNYPSISPDMKLLATRETKSKPIGSVSAEKKRNEPRTEVPNHVFEIRGRTIPL